MNSNAQLQVLRKLPTKWAIALIGLLILYALTQPMLNRQFGWHLPSLASLSGQPEPVKNSIPSNTGHDARPRSDAKESRREASPASPPSELPAETPRPDAQATEREAGTTGLATIERTKDRGNSSKPPAVKTPELLARMETGTKPAPADARKSGEATGEKKTGSHGAPSQLLHGILKETSRDNYISLAGLRYTPGSEEGHRLKHLERHLTDIPTRPGKHGVFDGDMAQALKRIDDAYERGTRGAKGTRKTEEQNATVYEVPFDKPIGYVGGRDGGRAGHPAARRIRLVVDGNRFITAFPF